MRIEKNELMEKLNRIKGVVPRQCTMSCQTGILIDDGCMIANDLEVSAAVHISGNDTFIIPADAFDLLSKLPNTEIDFQPEGNHVCIKAGKVKSAYSAQNPEDFQRIIKHESKADVVSFSIDGTRLFDSIRRVFYAIGNAQTNAVMNCLYLHGDGNVVNVIGLDGHMVSWDKIPCEAKFKMLLSRNAVQKILSIGLSGTIDVCCQDKNVEFSTEDCSVSARLVEGEYFNVAMMIRDVPLRVDVDRKSLMDAISREISCVKDETKRQAVKLSFSERQLEITARSQAFNYSETIDLQNECQEDVELGFNPRFLLETLKSFDTDDVELCMGTCKEPMTIKCESDYIAVILPVLMR